MGASNGVHADVCLAYDSTAHHVVGTWADSSTQIAFSTIYDGTSWSTAPAQIPLGMSSGVATDISLTYDSNGERIFGAWADKMTSAPYFSIYDGTSWSEAAALIPPGESSGAYSLVALTYNPNTKQVFAAWGDSSTNTPYYSSYTGSNWDATATALMGDSGVYQGLISLCYGASTNQVFAIWVNTNQGEIFFSESPPPSPRSPRAFTRPSNRR